MCRYPRSPLIHPAFGDQLKVSIAFVVLISEEIHLVANLERVGANHSVQHECAFDVVERVSEAGQDSMVEDDRVKAIYAGIVAILDRDRVQHVERVFAATDVVVARSAMDRVITIVVLQLQERRLMTHVAKLRDWLVFLQATPCGELCLVVNLHKVVVVDETVGLQRDLRVVARVRLRVERHLAVHLDHRRL